jgi:3',5'-cyclic AMP phosphodiesterase CpdA
VYRIAHVSDLHVLSPRGFEWRGALFNKRLTGYANLVLHRGRVFRRAYLRAVLAAAAAWADHVVVTGDVTNLSLEREFEEARDLLDELARAVEVTVVPGNHDAYLSSVHAERRFSRHFGVFLRSDLPALAGDDPEDPFPSVKLRGPVAIVALSSAIPRPPFVASGRVGAAQLAALTAILAHPEVARRTPVVLVHHPPVDDRSRLRVLRDGLVDAAALRAALAPLPRGAVLFGHLHVRMCRPLATGRDGVVAYGASGAALDHPDPAVRAGFNAYAWDDFGTLVSAEAHVLAPDGCTLDRRPLDVRSEAP